MRKSFNGISGSKAKNICKKLCRGPRKLILKRKFHLAVGIPSLFVFLVPLAIKYNSVHGLPTPTDSSQLTGYIDARNTLKNPSSKNVYFKEVNAFLRYANTSAQSTIQNEQESKIEKHESYNEIQLSSYSAALINLREASNLSAELEVVIQHLIENPVQTYAMFDECSNYLMDLDVSVEDASESFFVSYYQNFSTMPQFIRAYGIEDGIYLIIMPCWIGPYWQASANFIYDINEKAPQFLSLFLPTYDIRTNQVLLSISNINYGFQSFDENSRTLTLHHRYSSLGHCGFQATYLLENNQFILIEFRERNECDDLESIPTPGHFPQVYP
jgi:hypothetical protein